MTDSEKLDQLMRGVSSLDKRSPADLTRDQFWTGVGSLLAAGIALAGVSINQIDVQVAAAEKTLKAHVDTSASIIRDEIRVAREELQAGLRDGLALIGERIDTNRDGAALMASRQDVRSLEDRVGRIQQDLGQIAGRLDQIAATQRAQAAFVDRTRAVSWEDIAVPAGFEDVMDKTEGSSGFILHPEAFVTSVPNEGYYRFDALRTLLEEGALEPVPETQ